MSSKSDRDNRANQLNPNNSAYHLSRGGAGCNADDEDGGPSWSGYDRARAAQSVFASFAAMNLPPTPARDLWRIEKLFFFDLVDLDGQTRHFQFMGRAFHSMLDAEDVAEKWLSGLRSGLYEYGVPLAMYRAVDPDSGREYEWMSGRYRSGSNMSIFYPNPVQRKKVIKALDAKWERTGKAAVERVLAEWRTVARIDLGACTDKEMQLSQGGERRLGEHVESLRVAVP
ncbi:hypothetical protein EZ313_22110 [Ramlibacter henchirensis]|uniref:Uncharacterized protein n=1 Tax=Ramlibacter henchirensis TaxID=204072 RepID=A0A4Z0BKG2_9BURK|nr:hypothetical protein [Ramlibacter henchirensis]TFY99261.1 hypothetical protein EZ313_22110 [Ramlibacter henchirensis]